MPILPILTRVRSKYRRTAARMLYRRPFVVNTNVPLVSFSFDDFPRSALHAGGEILMKYGAKGTYYAAFGLMGKQAPTGEIFVAEDLDPLFRGGHELGCHTFAHCDSAETEPKEFEESIVENRRALKRFFPEAEFRTMSYPLNQPRAKTKQRMQRYFTCCRGGGQTFNAGTADLNCLAAHFLEQARGDLDGIKALIDDNCRACGWLIFATHDVSTKPTPWGSTPEMFEEIVRYAANSGSRILTMFDACKELGVVSQSELAAEGVLVQEIPSALAQRSCPDGLSD